MKKIIVFALICEVFIGCLFFNSCPDGFHRIDGQCKTDADFPVNPNIKKTAIDSETMCPVMDVKNDD